LCEGDLHESPGDSGKSEGKMSKGEEDEKEFEEFWNNLKLWELFIIHGSKRVCRWAWLAGRRTLREKIKSDE